MSIDLTAQIPEWEREASEHEEKARALRQIIEGVRALNGDADRLFGITQATGPSPVAAPSPDTPSIPPPRGREAVLMIVTERPGIWKVSEIKRQILARGWPYSQSGVEAACRRLTEDGYAERVKKGYYRFGLDPAPDTQPEAAETEVIE